MFHRGQLVECVETDFYESGPNPVKGQVYTVAETFDVGVSCNKTRCDSTINLQFEELRFEGDQEWLPGFCACCFRPLDKKRLEVFHQLLVTPPRDKVSA